ncbi:MAG: SAM-dependent methyltransferase [Clostridiales bacterium]|nr:SAM-dependent methyltransferase [Clostridiales bacterium]
MKVSNNWQDYKVLATGDGEKLEVWGNVKLLRPDPQVIWHAKRNLKKESGLNAHYIRESTGGGHWENLKPMPSEWQISYKNLKFLIKPMGFKHTGLFPEQAVNWDYMTTLIKNANRPIKVLNLFGYTGGATVACTAAGAEVTHVDASKGMVDRCKQNIKLSGLDNMPIRYIVDDCAKFVEREIRRGKFYDAIIMDPPSYGRGPSGEMWKIENNLYDFVKLCKNVLSDKPLFVLINSYTTGLQPMVLQNILNDIFTSGQTEAYEVGLKTEEAHILLPCGASGITIWKN